MKRKIDVAVADWKDVGDLLAQITRIVNRRAGRKLKLQLHDIGTDDYIVTISTGNVSRA